MALRCNRNNSDSDEADWQASSNAFRQAEGSSVEEPSTIPSHKRRCSSLLPLERQNTDSIDSPYRSTFWDLEADVLRDEEGVCCTAFDLDTRGVRSVEEGFRSAVVGSFIDGEFLMMGDCSELLFGALFSFSLPASAEEAKEGIFSDGIAKDTLFEESMARAV